MKYVVSKMLERWNREFIQVYFFYVKGFDSAVQYHTYPNQIVSKLEIHAGQLRNLIIRHGGDSFEGCSHSHSQLSIRGGMTVCLFDSKEHSRVATPLTLADTSDTWRHQRHMPTFVICTIRLLTNCTIMVCMLEYRPSIGLCCLININW